GSSLAHSTRACRRADRRADALIGPATADVGDGGFDIGVGRLRVVPQQRRDRHDHAALAIAALRNVELEPGLLHGMQDAARGEALDGDDLAAGDRAYRQRAGADRLAVEVHRAGAALRDT